MFDGQLPLGEPEALCIQATYEVPFGWSMQIACRRQFNTWGATPWAHYSRLTTEELADTISAAVASALEICIHSPR
jgi:hypothetical protein